MDTRAIPQADQPPTVFISYSQESDQHMTRVRELSDQLRQEGIDCRIDQYEDSPAEGWPRWMSRMLVESDWVLVACTDIYTRRLQNDEEFGKGRGAKWEGALIAQMLHDREANPNFIPIVFRTTDVENIPLILRGATHYNLGNVQEYVQLYRRLTGQPSSPVPSLGATRILPPAPIKGGAAQGGGAPSEPGWELRRRLSELLDSGPAGPTEGIHAVAASTEREIERLTSLAALPLVESVSSMAERLRRRGVITPATSTVIIDLFALRNRLSYGEPVPAPDARNVFDLAFAALRDLQAISPMVLQFDGTRFYLHWDEGVADGFSRPLRSQANPDYDVRSHEFVLMNLRGELYVQGLAVRTQLPMRDIRSIYQTSERPPYEAKSAYCGGETYWVVPSFDHLVAVDMDRPVEAHAGFGETPPLKRLIVSLEHPERFVEAVREQMDLENVS